MAAVDYVSWFGVNCWKGSRARKKDGLRGRKSRGKVPAKLASRLPFAVGLGIPAVDKLLSVNCTIHRTDTRQITQHVSLSRSQAGVLSGLATPAADFPAPFHRTIEQRLTHDRPVKHSRSPSQLLRRKSRLSSYVDDSYICSSLAQPCSRICP